MGFFSSVFLGTVAFLVTAGFFSSSAALVTSSTGFSVGLAVVLAAAALVTSSTLAVVDSYNINEIRKGLILWNPIKNDRRIIE